MKQTLNVAVSFIKTVTQIVDIDLPETSTYYKDKYKDGYSSTIFGIVLRSPTAAPGNYYLVKVTSNRQEFDDFNVASDVRSEYFIESKHNPLRKEAYKIISKNQLCDYEEITEAEFNAHRGVLIDNYLEWSN